MKEIDNNEILKAIFEYHTSKSETGDSVDDFVKFWQKSYNHFNIILILGSVKESEDGYTYEEICALYPKKFGGRTTLLTILNEGCEKKFFNKCINVKDHRKHNYTLEIDRKKHLIKWIENHPISKLIQKS